MHPQSTEPTAGYRVAFDVMAGVEPLTFPASATVAEITAKVVEAFEAAGVEIDAKVRVDIASGVVTVANEDGDVFEHGSITRIDEQPPVEPDLRQRLAAELHRIADDIANQRLPLGHYPSLRFGVVGSRTDLDRWADYLGTTLDASDSTGIPSVTTRIQLGDTRYGPELTIGVQSPKEQSELERLRAENARLEAKLAESGEPR